MAWAFQVFARHNLNFYTFLGLWLACLLTGWFCLVRIFLLLKKKGIRALYRDGLLWKAFKQLLKDLVGLNGKKIVRSDNRQIVILLIIERITWITPLIYVLFSGQALSPFIQAFVWICSAWVVYRVGRLVISFKKK